MMKRIFALLTAVLFAATAMTACGKKSSEKATGDESGVPAVANRTQAPVETIAASVASVDYLTEFPDLLTGEWVTYDDDGCPITYTFDTSGVITYSKDDGDDVDFSYTFADGILTVTANNRSFVYLCSEQAVDMIANSKYGQIRQYYSDQAESLPGFNGCVYVSGDFLYFGMISLCRADSLDDYTISTLEGDWVGALGDTVSFDADGEYTYMCEGEQYIGNYVEDFENNTLTIVLGGESTEYKSESWGVDGRVMHIKNRYYFKAD